LSLYAASKSLVLSFSRGLRFELRKTGVNVTCVCPGATDTDFVNRAQIGEKARKTAEKVNMTPEEVGRAAVNAMFARKAEVITGVVNKVGGFLTWLLPKKVLEGGAARIYE
jgi:short-subunit dehydrogenase